MPRSVLGDLQLTGASYQIILPFVLKNCVGSPLAAIRSDPALSGSLPKKDRVIQGDIHAPLSHRGGRLRAHGGLGRKRIGTKLPSSLGVPGFAVVCETYGWQLNAKREK